VPMMEDLDRTVLKVIRESQLDLSQANEVYSRATDLYLEIPRAAKALAKDMGLREVDEGVFLATLRKFSERPSVKQDKYLTHAFRLEQYRLEKLIDLRKIAEVLLEPEYGEKSLNWGEVCLDATYHAADAYYNIHRIEKYRKLESLGKEEEILVMEELNPNKWEKEDYVEYVDPERFLLPLIDKSRGGFRQRLDLEPDVYSTDDGCRIIFDLTRESRLSQKIIRHFEKICLFLASCQDENTGGFSDRPFLTPTVAITFAAAYPLSMMIKWCDSLNRPFPCDFKVPYDKTIQYLCSECRKDIDDMTGFANTPYDEPMLCSTYYVVRAIRHFLELQSKGLKDLIDEGTGKRILNFVKHCWREQDGGFTCLLDSKRATLIHTRYAILTIMELVKNGILKSGYLAEDLHPNEIARFLFSCLSHGGFAALPGVQPTVYSTRAAVRIIRNLEVLRITKKIETSKEYEEEMGKFDRKEVEMFLRSCYDKQKLGYAGLPLS